MASIKLQTLKTLVKLSLSLTPSIQQRRSLIIHYIPFKSIWLLYYKNLGDFSTPIPIIPLNSGNAQVVAIGSFTKLLIRRPKNSILLWLFYGKCHRILARKGNAITLLTIGKWPSKHQTTKGTTSLSYLTIKINCLNWLIPKVEYSSSISAIQTCFVLEPLEQSLIMHPLGSISLDSSLMKSSSAHAVIIPSSWDITSYMNARDSTTIGIHEEIP